MQGPADVGYEAYAGPFDAGIEALKMRDAEMRRMKVKAAYENLIAEVKARVVAMWEEMRETTNEKPSARDSSGK